MTKELHLKLLQYLLTQDLCKFSSRLQTVVVCVWSITRFGIIFGCLTLQCLFFRQNLPAGEFCTNPNIKKHIVVSKTGTARERHVCVAAPVMMPTGKHRAGPEANQRVAKPKGRSSPCCGCERAMFTQARAMPINHIRAAHCANSTVESLTAKNLT